MKMLELKLDTVTETPHPATRNDLRRIIMGKRIVVQKGDVYGRLTVIGEVEPKISSLGNKRRIVACKCICGVESTYQLGHLRSGRTQSCGCWNKELTIARSVTHGLTKHPAYSKWNHMISRTAKNSHHAARYYDRGIGVCEEWRDDPTEFCLWAERIGFNPSLELDRKDNNLTGDAYSPENCRFITRKANTENTCRSYWHFADGKVYAGLGDVTADTGISNSGAFKRYKSPNFSDWFRVPKYPSPEWLASVAILLHNSNVGQDQAA